MSIWFDQRVSAIGDSEELAKLVNIDVGHEATDWSFGPIHLHAGMKNAPPFSLTKMSKANPNVIFAVSSFCDTGGPFYRFLLLNGKHYPVLTVEDLYDTNTIDRHTKWAESLQYKREETRKLIEDYVPNPMPDPIPINEDTEIEFIDPVVNYEA